MKATRVRPAMRLSILAGAIMAFALPASAVEVGTVAAVEGTAEIGREGAWSPATVGTAIAQGDQLQTGDPGRLRVVFEDDSVLTLGDDTKVTVDEHVFKPSEGETRSLMELLRGKITAVVSDYYHSVGASYEIKTVSAVAGVRGTEFSVTYDPRSRLTEVVGISGVVSVHSTVDPTGPGVLVTAKEATQVAPGQLPTEPQRLDDSTFRQQLLGVDFIGAAALQNPSSSHPIVTGASVPAPDRAGTVMPASGVATTENGPASLAVDRPDASSLIGQSPAVVKSMTGGLDIDVGNH